MEDPDLGSIRYTSARGAKANPSVVGADALDDDDEDDEEEDEADLTAEIERYEASERNAEREEEKAETAPKKEVVSVQSDWVTKHASIAGKSLVVALVAIGSWWLFKAWKTRKSKMTRNGNNNHPTMTQMTQQPTLPTPEKRRAPTPAAPPPAPPPPAVVTEPIPQPIYGVSPAYYGHHPPYYPVVPPPFYGVDPSLVNNPYIPPSSAFPGATYWNPPPPPTTVEQVPDITVGDKLNDAFTASSQKKPVPDFLAELDDKNGGAEAWEKMKHQVLSYYDTVKATNQKLLDLQGEKINDIIKLERQQEEMALLRQDLQRLREKGEEKRSDPPGRHEKSRNHEVESEQGDDEEEEEKQEQPSQREEEGEQEEEEEKQKDKDITNKPSSEKDLKKRMDRYAQEEAEDDAARGALQLEALE